MKLRHGLTLALALVAFNAVADDEPTQSQQAARAASAAVQEAEPAVGGSPAPATPAKAPKPGKGAKRPGANSSTSLDRLELDTTLITGNRELPKVMVIVPWKRADIGELVGRPVNSLIDEALQPLDREVFRRELDYYGTLAPDRPRNETHVTGGSAADRPEK
jgi:hypothetical protein